MSRANRYFLPGYVWHNQSCSRFQSFQSFNPPDIFRGPFKSFHKQTPTIFTSRDERQSESIAVGSLAFVETVNTDLGVKATHREVIGAAGSYALRELTEVYGLKFRAENEALNT